MPVFEEFPYTNFHELNLDWIIQEIKKLKEPGNIEELEQHRIFSHFRYYVDGISGNDNNDGLSSAAPFKTLDKAMSMSSVYSQLRINLMTSGIYTCTTGDVIDNMTIQITALAPDITLMFTGDNANDFVFYGGYLRLDGKDVSNKMTVIVQPKDGVSYGSLSAVNSLFRFENCIIPYNAISGNGANIQLETCEFKSLYLHDGNGHIVNGHVLNTDPDVRPLHVLNTKIALTGTWTVEEPTAATSVSFMLARYSDLTIQSVLVPAGMTNQYLYGIEGVGCYVNITAARQAAIAANTASGNKLDANPDMNNVFNPF